MTEKKEITIEVKLVKSLLDQHMDDFVLLEDINNQLVAVNQYINDNRKNCLDGTQPILNIVGSALRDVQNILQIRGNKIKADYEKLDLIEEAQSRLEQRLRRSKK